MRRLALLSLCAFGFGCPKLMNTEPAVPKSGPPRAYQLLAEVPDRETESFEEKREDVEVDTRDFDRTPRVVTVGESPIIRLQGARAKLCGDEACEKGFAVDNFLLLEVLTEKGQVQNRVVVGMVEGAMIGAERIDNLGRAANAFDPGEIDITSRLPESSAFKLRATALDYGVVGKVSDVYLLLEYSAPRGPSDDDLRER